MSFVLASVGILGPQLRSRVLFRFDLNANSCTQRDRGKSLEELITTNFGKELRTNYGMDCQKKLLDNLGSCFVGVWHFLYILFFLSAWCMRLLRSTLQLVVPFFAGGDLSFTILIFWYSSKSELIEGEIKSCTKNTWGARFDLGVRLNCQGMLDFLQENATDNKILMNWEYASNNTFWSHAPNDRIWSHTPNGAIKSHAPDDAVWSQAPNNTTWSQVRNAVWSHVPDNAVLKGGSQQHNLAEEG